MALEKTDVEHPNADLVRRARRIQDRGHRRGGPPVRRRHRLDRHRQRPGERVTKGMGGVLANFGDIMHWTEGTYDADPVDYLGSAGHAINLSHVTATRPDGRRLDQDELVVFTVRDGKLATAQHVAYDEAAWDAFFA